MKVDVGTVWGFAAVSLLTGREVCTMPTEIEEINKRAKDMMAMLGDVEFIQACNSLFPSFPVDKWPFATDSSEMKYAACKFVEPYKVENRNEEADIAALVELLKCDAIENKYRLSLVKKDVMREVLTPF